MTTIWTPQPGAERWDLVALRQALADGGHLEHTDPAAHAGRPSFLAAASGDEGRVRAIQVGPDRGPRPRGAGPAQRAWDAVLRTWSETLLADGNWRNIQISEGATSARHEQGSGPRTTVRIGYEDGAVYPVLFSEWPTAWGEIRSTRRAGATVHHAYDHRGEAIGWHRANTGGFADISDAAQHLAGWYGLPEPFTVEFN